MIGKQWAYKSKVLLFQGIEIMGESKLKLITDDREFVFENKSMLYFFIEDCKEVSQKPAIVPVP